jgi:hypothetical protein
LLASLAFESVNGREPKAGDVLSFEDVAGDRSEPLLAAFMFAWNRALRRVVCPLKLENGVLYFRTLGNRSGEGWQEKTEVGPQARWRTVERAATGALDCLEDMPTLPAIGFLGVTNGKPHCKTLSSQPENW